MTDIATARPLNFERWGYKQFPLAVTNIAYKGTLAALDLSTGKCEPGHVEADLLTLGTFDETVDATSEEKLVNVRLSREIEVAWFANSTGTPITAIGGLCYLEDNQTVTGDPTGASVAGRVWAVDAVKGVAVELAAALNQ